MNEKSIPFTDCPPFPELNLKIILKPCLKRSALLNNVFTEGELHNKMIREGPIFYCFVLLRSSLATQNLHCLVLCRPTVVIEPCSGNLRPVKNKRKALPLSVKLSQCHVCHLQPEHVMLTLFNPCCYCRSLCGLLIS